MIRTIILAASAILATALITQATAQPAATVHKASFTSVPDWSVVRAGQPTVSHCIMGLRSNAAAPSDGSPQLMFIADRSFAILRVRAAEWSFSGSRDIVLTLVTSTGSVRQPAAVVRGADLVDIAFGAEPGDIDELATSSQLEIQTEGTTVYLPLTGLTEVLPAFRLCLASIGEPKADGDLHASVPFQGL
jgi:hypothetical protein